MPDKLEEAMPLAITVSGQGQAQSFTVHAV